MSDNKNPTPRPHREIASNIEEEDLWEMDDDWAIDEETEEAQSEAASDLPSETPDSPPTAVDDTPSTENYSEPVIETVPAETVPAETPDEDNAIVDSPAEETDIVISPDQTTAPEPENEEAATATEKPDKAAGPKKKPIGLGHLSLLEKLSLAVMGLAFLGLAISSYIWLHNKNQNGDNDKLELPATGEHVTVSEFSTYWTTAKKSHEIRMGAKVLPSADITLSPDSKTSGALRINFHNAEGIIIGDPITLGIKNGKFSPVSKSNLSISDEGGTAHVIASDGFHQEGDYSAYVIDGKLSWTVKVYEAESAGATGSSFKKLLETSVVPKRR